MDSLVKRMLCDNCKFTRGLHAHRCHNPHKDTQTTITVDGKFIKAVCDCECNNRPSEEELARWAAAGHPSDFEFQIP